MTKQAVGRFKVYVVRLLDTVMGVGKYRKANPGYVEGSPHVYVGSTAEDPETRFRKHKDGGRTSSNIVRDFGDHLMADLTKTGLPTREVAEAEEDRTAAELREQGWGVWCKAAPFGKGKSRKQMEEGHGEG